MNVVTELAEDTAAERPGRNRFVRVIDPFDLAGKTARTVLPTHPTPAAAHVVFYLALGAMVAAELVDPPLALLLAGGHLMLNSHNQYLQELGSALEEGA